MKNSISLKFNNHKVKLNLLNMITVLYFCRIPIINFFQGFEVGTTIVVAVIVLLLIGTFLMYFFTNLKKIQWDGILLVLSILIFFEITIVIHPEYIKYYSTELFSAKSVFEFGAAIYAYYIIKMNRYDTENLYDVFGVIAFIIFIANIGTFINRNAEYDMAFGYQMSMAAIIFISQYFYRQKKIIYFIMSILSMGLGILYGSRACVIGYVVFITLFFIWERKITLKLFFFLLVGVIGVIILNSGTFLMIIYNFFSSIGLESRTLYLLVSESIALDVARTERIWPLLLEHIQNSGIFEPLGAFGDRYLLSGKYSYAHNIVLEVLVTFGNGVGTLFLSILFWAVVRVIRKENNVNGLLVLMFGSFSICRLMVSSSFWHEPYFWAFLAMLIIIFQENIYSKIRGHI